MKKTALVIAPGRGTYNSDELGYLKRHHADKRDFIKSLDTYRKGTGQIPVSELDGAEKYSLADHTSGDNASPLIYGCAYSDFLSIDRDKIDIVAVSGNSMGWYIALACAGALSPDGGMDVINTMGTLMQESLIGGQIIYPFVDENWEEISGKYNELKQLTEEIADLYISIALGGMIVFAGSTEALATLEERLPRVQDRFPLRLPNHAAFHTPLMAPIAKQGRDKLPADLFSKPTVPLIDGRGHIWTPYSTDTKDIWSYTLDHQVCQTYDFSKAVQVGVQEFAPDYVIALGPGTTLGGAIAQSLIEINWHDMESKDDFIKRQKSDPFLISLGIDGQRNLAV